MHPQYLCLAALPVTLALAYISAAHAAVGHPLAAVQRPARPPTTTTDLADVALDESQLRVHFIDVGPGLAALIETPSGRHIFIDGGKWGVADMEDDVRHFANPDTTATNPNGIPIDVAIVTHADYDHYKGQDRIFEHWQVNEYWNTGYASDDLPPSWGTFSGIVQAEQDCTIYSPIGDWVEPGQTEILDDGDTPDDDSDDVVILYLNVDADPPETDPIFGRSFSESERRNNASLVFKIIYGDVSFLFTGDINGRDKDHEDPSADEEIDSEELELWVRDQLDDRYDLAATVLQVSHHGSNGSSSLPFLRAVAPTWAVIPAGHQYDHPNAGTLRRLGQVIQRADHILRTDEGDSTPEVSAARDPRGDDCLIFQTDGTTITEVLRVTVH